MHTKPPVSGGHRVEEEPDPFPGWAAWPSSLCLSVYTRDRTTLASSLFSSVNM